ncbi:MAG: DMT family transporter [Pseudomonadota bacterium]
MFERFIAPVLFVFIWSTGFVVAGGVAGFVDPNLFLALRFSAVALIFGAVALALRQPLPDLATVLRLMFIGLFMYAFYLGPCYWVVAQGMSVGVITLIATLQPPMTAVLSARLYGEPISGSLILGLALGIAGVAMAVWPTLDVGALGGTPLSHVGLAFLSVLSLTIGTLMQKARTSTVPLMTANAWQKVGGALGVAVAALLLGEGQLDVTPRSAFSYFWAVFVLSIAGMSLMVWMLRRGGATRFTALFFPVAPLAAIQGWILFGEILSPFQIAGFALTVLGVILARRQPRTALKAA